MLLLAKHGMAIFVCIWLGLIDIWRECIKGFGPSIEGEAL
jgi:hypothetical protein